MYWTNHGELANMKKEGDSIQCRYMISMALEYSTGGIYVDVMHESRTTVCQVTSWINSKSCCRNALDAHVIMNQASIKASFLIKIALRWVGIEKHRGVVPVCICLWMLIGSSRTLEQLTQSWYRFYTHMALVLHLRFLRPRLAQFRPNSSISTPKPAASELAGSCSNSLGHVTKSGSWSLKGSQVVVVRFESVEGEDRSRHCASWCLVQVTKLKNTQEMIDGNGELVLTTGTRTVWPSRLS
jgi:hypothetical protein